MLFQEGKLIRFVKGGSENAYELNALEFWQYFTINHAICQYGIMVNEKNDYWCEIEDISFYIPVS